MKMTTRRNGCLSKRIVQLISIPHSSGINLVSDCRNCTICGLETTFNSHEPKVRVRKGNHSPLSVDFTLEFPLENRWADGSETL